MSETNIPIPVETFDLLARTIAEFNNPDSSVVVAEHPITSAKWVGLYSPEGNVTILAARNLKNRTPPDSVSRHLKERQPTPEWVVTYGVCRNGKLEWCVGVCPEDLPALSITLRTTGHATMDLMWCSRNQAWRVPLYVNISITADTVFALEQEVLRRRASPSPMSREYHIPVQSLEHASAIEARLFRLGVRWSSSGDISRVEKYRDALLAHGFGIYFKDGDLLIRYFSPGHEPNDESCQLNLDGLFDPEVLEDIWQHKEASGSPHIPTFWGRAQFESGEVGLGGKWFPEEEILRCAERTRELMKGA